MWRWRLLTSKMSPNPSSTPSRPRLRPGKFATAFCGGRCASVTWFKTARGTADGRTFPPWRTSAAWQDVRVSYGLVSNHCKPSAGWLRLLREAAGPRGGKARRPQRKTRCGPPVVKKPGQNGQVKYRASPGVEDFRTSFVRMAKIVRWNRNVVTGRSVPLLKEAGGAAASTFLPGTPASSVHLRRKAPSTDERMPCRILPPDCRNPYPVPGPSGRERKQGEFSIFGSLERVEQARRLTSVRWPEIAI